MEWRDEGILLHQKNLSSTKNLATFFTSQHGLYKGAVRVSKKSPLQTGDRVSLQWRARLSTQLGQFYLDDTPLQRNTAVVLQDASMLALQNYIFPLLFSLLPHGHNYSKLYDQTIPLVEGRTFSLKTFFHWELCLLEELGFGLQLDSCAAPNCANVHLTHISPNTGHAVCKVHAAPYKARLLPYPSSEEKFLEHLKVSVYFLEKNFSESVPSQAWEWRSKLMS